MILWGRSDRNLVRRKRTNDSEADLLTLGTEL